jgi:excisionase family DNA binding protein
VSEVAAEIKVSVQTIRRAILTGDLRAVKLNRAARGTGRYRLRRSWVTTWLEGEEARDPRF